MKRLGFSLMAIIIVLSGSYSIASSQEPSFIKQVDRAKNSVYRVETKDSVFLGTAFTINKYGDLLTCFHVAEPKGIRLDSLYLRNYLTATVEQDTVAVQFNARFTATIKARVPLFDLAILHADTLQAGMRISYNFMGLTPSTNLQEGQEVALCAYIPDDFTIPKAFVSKGIVSTIRERLYDPRLKNTVELIQLDLTAAKGTSGGPIFLTSSGRVIAIQDAGIFETDMAKQTPYPIALTISQIVHVLDSLKIPYDLR